MLSQDEATARAVETVMRETYQRLGLEHHVYLTTINPLGCQVVENS
ncbi:hypothetical protein LRS06_10690 [Hymenobacter sp. J193]|nr:hypothetical protein [Hymenobacter sp. J193]MCR5888224.1 hypothetical protein [Hymenobacter sp. J193]